jgi:hypothetical protein
LFLKFSQAIEHNTQTGYFEVSLMIGGSRYCRCLIIDKNGYLNEGASDAQSCRV